MKLTIIPADGAVYLDGRMFDALDLSFVPPGIHALQWRDASGWIEYAQTGDSLKPANALIAELPQWAALAVAVWTAAHDAFRAREAQQDQQDQPAHEVTP